MKDYLRYKWIMFYTTAGARIRKCWRITKAIVGIFTGHTKVRIKRTK